MLEKLPHTALSGPKEASWSLHYIDSGAGPHKDAGLKTRCMRSWLPAATHEGIEKTEALAWVQFPELQRIFFFSDRMTKKGPKREHDFFDPVYMELYK